MSDDIKVIRMGDKIIVFANGKREVVSKAVSPETFEVIIEYLKNKDTKSIANLFVNFESKVSKYLGEFFVIKDGNIFSLEEKKQPYQFSRLILRKAIELLALNESPKTIISLSEKLKYINGHNVTLGMNDLFEQMKIIQLTKYGNLVLPVYMEVRNENEAKRVVGCPVNVDGKGEKKYGLNYSLEVHTRNTVPNFINDEGLVVPKKIVKVLASPFDIISATSKALNVSRYKIVDDIGDISTVHNGIVEIENEELFEIPYDIFKNFEKKLNKSVTVNK